ncbi:MAG: hypothetical protein LC650_04125 [Actinobacteria bacterium]|nr:hypothetical protein [Actinomycetota bacterium]
MVLHSRNVDPYEPVAEPRPFGDGEHTNLRMIWWGQEWPLSDFMALLVTRHQNPDTYQPDTYMATLSEYPVSARDELARFAFFLALSKDTRAMRVVCKRNNVLEQLALDCPRPQEILNLRQVLPSILSRYTDPDIEGHRTPWNWAQCRTAIIQALATGTLAHGDCADRHSPSSSAPFGRLVTSTGPSPWEERYYIANPPINT